MHVSQGRTIVPQDRSSRAGVKHRIVQTEADGNVAAAEATKQFNSLVQMMRGGAGGDGQGGNCLQFAWRSVRVLKLIDSVDGGRIPSSKDDANAATASV